MFKRATSVLMWTQVVLGEESFIEIYNAQALLAKVKRFLRAEIRSDRPVAEIPMSAPRQFS